MPRDRQALARHWLALAIGALAVSGALSLGVVLSRVPSVAHHLTDVDLARRFLVVHVGLGVVVWFSALPVTLFHLQRLAIGASAHVSPVGALAPWLSTVGASALLGGLVPGLGTVHPVNYVPAVAHPLYVSGLGLFFTGVVLSYLDRGTPGGGSRPPLSSARFSPLLGLPDPVPATLATTGAMVGLGGFYVLLAVVALGSAFGRLPNGLDQGTRLELMMWGPGHLLQFANIAFVLVAWALLAAWGSGRRPGGTLRWVVLALVAPVLPILVLLVRGPAWWFSRAGFVLLMQWTLFPAVVVFLAFTLAPHFLSRKGGPEAPSRDALWPLSASVVLMLVGFLYGALIRGSDLRIPGHYHACIGAVTLAYMALSLLLAGGAIPEARQSRPLRRVAALYGVGQLLFSTGLVLAGSYGLGRKTLGIEQHIGHGGQRIGLWVMATGGVLAFAGGAVWAVAMMRRLRRPERQLATASA
jgi:cytochrome c oxidase subunit I